MQISRSAMQWTASTLLGLGATSLIVVGMQRATHGQEPAARPAATTAAAAESFTAPPDELRSLGVDTVKTRVFATAVATEGRIGQNLERSTPVYSPFSGRVVRVIGVPGMHVSAGDPLLVVEASEFIQGQNDLVSASASLATARSQLDQARFNEERKHALYDAGAGSLQDWQQSGLDLASARNAERSAEVALNLARNRLRILGKTEAQIDAYQSAGAMESTVTVNAPIAGTITDRQVGTGQYVQAGGTTALFSIGDLSSVWLVGNVREQDAPLVRLWAPIIVEPLVMPGRHFRARLTYVAPAIDPQTRRLTVRAELANPDGILRPEMFATFWVTTGPSVSSPAVPEESVIYEGDEARVWVVGDNRQISLRRIEPGRSEQGYIEVVHGLREGERVVTSGALFIDRAVKRAPAARRAA